MSRQALLELRQLYKRFGTAVTADEVSLAIAKGEFFTLLGPSGSGKSTILRIIAGLERADSGTVLIDGRDVSGVAPWDRGLGMVFQHYANFPHMDVAGNVAYGLRRRGLSRARITRRVGELLDLVNLSGFESRRVHQLSGGEQQRVSIARALAPKPAILLLDEPLSALDEKIRREMQTELRRIQQSTGTTFIYVTHDQEEALTMSDRIAVLNAGRCVQCDTPERIFRFPRTRFVAGFFRGSNILEGRLESVESGNQLRLCGASIPFEAEERSSSTGAVAFAIRGEAVRLGEEAVEADLVMPARLTEVIYRGVYSDHRLVLADGQRLSAMTTRHSTLAEGSELMVGIRRSDLVMLEDD
jgi:ABC-type Fe3+/spermidine/putrescine transport system ATPase subunit